jgi:hypothetical protein
LKSEINLERKNRVFLKNEFLMQGGRSKNGIKNYRSDHHEFRDFWMSGAIKINSEKIKQIKEVDQGS